MSDSDIILAPVEIEKETDLAWLIDYEGKTYWVPKKECTIERDELSIPFWLAEDKGMI